MVFNVQRIEGSRLNECRFERLTFGFVRCPLFLLSVGVVEEFFPEQVCDGPGLAVAYDSLVDLDNSDNLGGGAGKEELIANIQVESREILLDHLNVFLPGQSDNDT